MRQKRPPENRLGEELKLVFIPNASQADQYSQIYLSERALLSEEERPSYALQRKLFGIESLLQPISMCPNYKEWKFAFIIWGALPI